MIKASGKTRVHRHADGSFRIEQGVCADGTIATIFDLVGLLIHNLPAHEINGPLTQEAITELRESDEFRQFLNILNVNHLTYKKEENDLPFQS